MKAVASVATARKIRRVMVLWEVIVRVLWIRDQRYQIGGVVVVW